MPADAYGLSQCPMSRGFVTWPKILNDANCCLASLPAACIQLHMLDSYTHLLVHLPLLHAIRAQSPIRVHLPSSSIGGKSGIEGEKRPTESTGCRLCVDPNRTDESLEPSNAEEAKANRDLLNPSG